MDTFDEIFYNETGSNLVLPILKHSATLSNMGKPAVFRTLLAKVKPKVLMMLLNLVNPVKNQLRNVNLFADSANSSG